MEVRTLARRMKARARTPAFARHSVHASRAWLGCQPSAHARTHTRSSPAWQLSVMAGSSAARPGPSASTFTSSRILGPPRPSATRLLASTRGPCHSRGAIPCRCVREGHATRGLWLHACLHVYARIAPAVQQACAGASWLRSTCRRADANVTTFSLPPARPPLLHACSSCQAQHGIPGEWGQMSACLRAESLL